MIESFIKKVNEGDINLSEHFDKVISDCERINEKFGCFNVLDVNGIKKQVSDLESNDSHLSLKGLVISVKDNICVKGVESCADSAILQNYRPVFDATVVKRLRDCGAVIIGKTSQDEFGFGSFNVNVGLNNSPPKNPFDSLRVAGGSSGGGAVITATADFAHVALVECTGGSIECPASFCGVFGFVPTYGRVSRFGLISYANSFDKIGLMSRSAKDLCPVLNAISGFDKNDMTSADVPVNFHCDKSKLRVGIIVDNFDLADSKIKDLLLSKVESLKENFDFVESVSLPISSKYALPVYYILALSEASTNLQKFCGLRYGVQENPKSKYFSDYFSSIRSKFFNDESKRRILLGTFVRMAGFRDSYYIKSAKLRTKIIQEYKSLFEKYDVLLSPTMSRTAPSFEEVKDFSALDSFRMDVLTVSPNIAGIPHASIPCGFIDNLPVGLMAMSNHFDEASLLKFVELFDDV